MDGLAVTLLSGRQMCEKQAIPVATGQAEGLGGGGQGGGARKPGVRKEGGLLRRSPSPWDLKNEEGPLAQERVGCSRKWASWCKGPEAEEGYGSSKELE